MTVLKRWKETSEAFDINVTIWINHVLYRATTYYQCPYNIAFTLRNTWNNYFHISHLVNIRRIVQYGSMLPWNTCITTDAKMTHVDIDKNNNYYHYLSLFHPIPLLRDRQFWRRTHVTCNKAKSFWLEKGSCIFFTRHVVHYLPRLIKLKGNFLLDFSYNVLYLGLLNCPNSKNIIY